MQRARCWHFPIEGELERLSPCSQLSTVSFSFDCL